MEKWTPKSKTNKDPLVRQPECCSAAVTIFVHMKMKVPAGKPPVKGMKANAEPRATYFCILRIISSLDGSFFGGWFLGLFFDGVFDW